MADVVVLQVKTCKHWSLEQTIRINLPNLQQQELSFSTITSTLKPHRNV